MFAMQISFSAIQPKLCGVDYLMERAGLAKPIEDNDFVQFSTVFIL